jgi:hypothetical protein
LKRCFETGGVHLKDVSSFIIWNAAETRIASPKTQRSPQVIVAKDAPSGTTTIAAMRNDAQLTLLKPISAFLSLISPLIIAKKQT